MARTATYECEPQQLLDLAIAGARDVGYEASDVDRSHTRFATSVRYLNRECEVPDRAGERTIGTRMFVTLVPQSSGYGVQVAPVAFRERASRRSPAEQPPCLADRADALAYAIYERARSCSASR